MMITLRDLVKGRKLITAKPSETISAVARRLKQANIGAAPVVDGSKLVGVFTERDLLTRVVAAGKDPRTLTIAKVMTKNPVLATPKMGVLEGLTLMRKFNIRHLPLVMEGKLLGMVSQRDCITAIMEMKEEEIDALKEMLDLLPIEPGVG